MASIQIGGLATGLDTNSIIDKLVSLERRRSVDFLTAQQTEARGRQSALSALQGKLLSFRSAISSLREESSALAYKATSSDTTVLTATAGSGAATGSTSVTVNALARGSIATSGAAGLTSENATIATGSGSFEFKLGTGETRSVAVDSTTTLAQLAAGINGLSAGVTASVINIGTSAAPDYRLRLGSLATGTSSDITIVNDPTSIAVAVTQTAANASFTVSGFATPITRESNVVSDVIPGVTLTLLKEGGTATVGVDTDAEAIGTKLKAVVDAFNDLVAFVRQQSEVTQDSTSDDRTVSSGPLAFDPTVRNLIDSVHSAVSGKVDGLSSDFSLLAEVGIKTNQDGTLAFDAGALSSALGTDKEGVRQLFAGSGSVGGAFDRVFETVENFTKAGGLLDIRNDAVDSELRSLEDRIASGQHQLELFEQNLRATFTSLEVLVGSLQSQSSFLLQALGNRTA